MIDAVSDCTKTKWAEVWEMPVFEFFNYLAYYLEKNRRERAEIEKFKHR